MPFKKGQSGNPAGRRAEIGPIRDLARQHSPRAFERVVSLIDDADPKVALAAAQEVMNRGWGRPAQALIGGGEDDPPLKFQVETVIRPI
jgi:hypothetical protein